MAVNIEQSITALNLQLGEANAQIAFLSTALDTLRTESVAAVLDLRRQVATNAPASSKPKNVQFINTKTFEGGKFAGGVKESFKAWAKKVKIFLNSQHRGMRQALEVCVRRLATRSSLQISKGSTGNSPWRPTRCSTISS